MLKHLLRFVLITSLTVWCASAQDLTGDWLGTLRGPSGDLRFALHINKAESGLQGTLDSLDQGVSGIPMASIQFSDSKLAFKMPAIQASYEGTVDPSGAAIEGAITSKEGSAPLAFRRGTIAKIEHKPAKPSDIDGDWTGTLAAGGEEQTYRFHIRNTEDGLIVLMDLDSQHIKGAEASTVERKDSSISMEWKAFGSRFEGKIATDRGAIAGTVAQAGYSFPFTLKRIQQ